MARGSPTMFATSSMRERALFSTATLPIVLLALTQTAAAQDTIELQPVEVTAPATDPDNWSSAPQTPPIKQAYQLPQTSESITAAKIQQTVNVVDTEDAIKYFPSLFVRKRNYGDTQPTLSTRTWGVNSSARNLVYVDDILLSALIANNNTLGAPRWGLVSPEEIK